MFPPLISNCLWKILGTVPCSFLPLGSGGRFAADEQGRSQRPLSALFGQLLSPMSWPPAIHSQSLGGHFVVFGPCDRVRLQHTSRGVVYITQSHLDNLHFFFSFPFWLTGSKAPKVGVSVWKFPWYNFTGCRWEAKWSWRGLCWKKSVINLHQVEVSVLMYYHSKCSSCGLRLPWLTKERRSSWGTALALSFPMSLALSWQE